MAQAAWANVRIKKETKSILDEMAHELDISQGAVIEFALDRLRRQRILESAAAAYDRMREDPEAAQAFDEEMEAWDHIPDEGLENV